MLSLPNALAVLATLAASACASSEEVDPTRPDAASGGSLGSGGGGALSGGGFPSVADSSDDSPTGTGAGGTGGSVCGPEVCNGLDDDCNGTADDGVCSPGCTGREYIGQSYSLCSTAKPLSDAAADCIAQKMRAARPNDLAENDWLRQTATSLGLGAFWMGATDWTTEGDWEWPDGAKFWTGGASGSPVGSAYTNWAPKHPTGTGSNDCMQMDAAGTWNEVGCNKTAVYVCEDY